MELLMFYLLLEEAQVPIGTVAVEVLVVCKHFKPPQLQQRIQ